MTKHKTFCEVDSLNRDDVASAILELRMLYVEAKKKPSESTLSVIEWLKDNFIRGK